MLDETVDCQNISTEFRPLYIYAKHRQTITSCLSKAGPLPHRWAVECVHPHKSQAESAARLNTVPKLPAARS